MSSLDVKRLKGVSAKRLGLIKLANELAKSNQEFLPYWLPQKKFNSDCEYFVEMVEAYSMIDQMRKIAANILVAAANNAYTDSLDFYASVREAAKRGIDPADTVRAELAKFFKPCGSWVHGKQTQKKLLQDIKGLLHGTKEGKVVVENESPHVVEERKQVVVDELDDE